MNNLLRIEDIAKCECGAVTVLYRKGFRRDHFSMSGEVFEKRFPFLKPTGDAFHNCNHCANNWGVDLCACGSGEKVGKCEEHFECGQSLQSIPYEIEDMFPEQGNDWLK